MKIVIRNQPKIIIFTAVKNRCMLHGRVFVMIIAGTGYVMLLNKPGHGNVKEIEKQ